MKQSGCWEQDSLPEPSNIQCWQRSSSSAGPQVIPVDACILGLPQRCMDAALYARAQDAEPPAHTSSMRAHAALQRWTCSLGHHSPHRLALNCLAVQVLHSSAAILQLFQAGRWDIQQRLSHCSRPGESMSFAAVHAACDGLSKHLKDLLRNPVVIASSKVCHQPPSLTAQPAESLSITGMRLATGCDGGIVLAMDMGFLASWLTAVPGLMLRAS